MAEEAAAAAAAASTTSSTSTSTSSQNKRLPTTNNYTTTRKAWRGIVLATFLAVLALVWDATYLLRISSTASGTNNNSNNNETTNLHSASSSGVWNVTSRNGSNNNSSNNSDPSWCGLIDDWFLPNSSRSSRQQPPVWIPVDAADQSRYHAVDRCVRRLDLVEHDPAAADALVQLPCSPSWTRTFRATLGQYRRVAFFGDSILRQQFLTFCCWLDPTITKAQIEVQRGKHYQYNFTTTKDTRSTNDTTTTTTTTTTHLEMRAVGYLFERNQTGFFKTHVPTALRTFTANDAIVLNGASHYFSNDADVMERTVQFLAHQSTLTAAQVFFMEPHNEEWPTANGMYTRQCAGKCVCEPLDEARLQGHGALAVAFVNASVAAAHLVPVPSVFQRLYPEPQPSHYYDFSSSAITAQSPHCIPDCVPPRWKVDLVRSTVTTTTTTTTTTTNATNTNHMTVVPVWWQLVSLGMYRGVASARRHADCTHKDARSILFMNSQLIRSMMMRMPPSRD
jgi:hypothetical protein